MGGQDSFEGTGTFGDKNQYDLLCRHLTAMEAEDDSGRSTSETSGSQFTIKA